MPPLPCPRARPKRGRRKWEGAVFTLFKISIAPRVCFFSRPGGAPRPVGEIHPAHFQPFPCAPMRPFPARRPPFSPPPLRRRPSAEEHPPARRKHNSPRRAGGWRFHFLYWGHGDSPARTPALRPSRVPFFILGHGDRMHDRMIINEKRFHFDTGDMETQGAGRLWERAGASGRLPFGGRKVTFCRPKPYLSRAKTYAPARHIRALREHCGARAPQNPCRATRRRGW